MAELTYRDAVIRGIAQEMARDPDVVFLGEDVAKAGGVFKATVGLFEQFGPLRVRDTPISEQAILGAALHFSVASSTIFLTSVSIATIALSATPNWARRSR